MFELSVIICILFAFTLNTFYLCIGGVFMICLVVHLSIQILSVKNRKKGGRFLHPDLLNSNISIEEEHIFLFIDLVSSTKLAVKLGQKKYNAFLQDCFTVIGSCANETNAYFYQIIGDEAVLVWKYFSSENCVKVIDFYFLFMSELRKYNDNYMSRYGVIPQFSASINSGKIKYTELNKFKTTLTYHGKTLKTAAKIKRLCKNYAYPILVTKSFIDKLAKPVSSYLVVFLDEVKLQGENEPIEIFGIRSLNEQAK